MKEYKFKHILGILGDTQAERWTEEDWKDWEEHCQRMREGGIFGTEESLTFKVVDNPIFDLMSYRDEATSPLFTPKFMILDLFNEKNTNKENI